MRSFVDTLTIILHDDGEMEWLEDLYDLFGDIGIVAFENCKFGKNHYKNGGLLLCNGAILAEVNWGGDTQARTVQVMLKGLGCGLIKDWNTLVNKLSEFAKCKISRLDIAIDIFDGSLNLEEFYELRNDRTLWVGKKGGKPPKFFPMGDMRETSEYGRSVYIGTRDSDLYTRVYEKGMERFSKMKGSDKFPNARNQSVIFEDGWPAIRVGDYVRFECEFKAKTTIIPLTALLDTDSFISGAYPYVAKLLNNTTPIKRLRIEQEVMGDLDSILRQVQKQYGPSFVIALEKYGVEVLISKILSNNPSRKLINKGINFATASQTPRFVDNETGELI